MDSESNEFDERDDALIDFVRWTAALSRGDMEANGDPADAFAPAPDAGDLDQDGRVTTIDVRLLGEWIAAGDERADLNADGVQDANDLAVMLRRLNTAGERGVRR